MYYETVFIVNPDVSQENNEVMTDELVDKIEKAGARIVKREYWGSRPLAYSIQKRKRGHYSLLVIDGASNMSKIIDDTLRLDERILRFLTTSITEFSDEPSPLLRRRVTSTTTGESAADASKTPATEDNKEVTAQPKAEEKTEAKEVAVEEKVATETPVEKESGATANA